IQERVLLRQFVLVPARDAVSLRPERQREPELRADAIAVGPDVSDDADRPAFTDAGQNAVYDFRVGLHRDFTGNGVGPESRRTSYSVVVREFFSSSSMIS